MKNTKHLNSITNKLPLNYNPIPNYAQDNSTKSPEEIAENVAIVVPLLTQLALIYVSAKYPTIPETRSY